MKIRKLSVDGFRGLPDRELSLLDPRTDAAFGLVLVTGPRASGKTSLLEAIIAAKEQIGPYGPELSASSLVRLDATAAKVRVEWELSGAERARYGIETPFFDAAKRTCPPKLSWQGPLPPVPTTAAATPETPKPVATASAARVAPPTATLPVADQEIELRQRVLQNRRQRFPIHKRTQFAGQLAQMLVSAGAQLFADMALGQDRDAWAACCV